MIECAWYDSDGSLRFKQQYQYDSLGNKILDTHYTGEIMKPTSMKEREITYRK